MRGAGARQRFSPTELHEGARRAPPAELLQTLDLVGVPLPRHFQANFSLRECKGSQKKELNLCHDDLPKGESGLFCDVTMSEGTALYHVIEVLFFCG